MEIYLYTFPDVKNFWAKYPFISFIVILKRKGEGCNEKS